jgi:hypothetical protein
MIEILGVKLSYEALLFLSAFVASEVIGESKLKQNSVLGLVKTLIDGLKPYRKEDEKVAALKAKAVALVEEAKTLGK